MRHVLSDKRRMQGQQCRLWLTMRDFGAAQVGVATKEGELAGAENVLISAALTGKGL